MSDYSNPLPNVGNTFDAPKKGLHIAHDNPEDAWAIYAAGNGDNITIAFTDDTGLRIVFLTDQPNKVGYLRSFSGVAYESVNLDSHDQEKGVYYGVLSWPAPTFYTGMPFNGDVSDPFRIFDSLSDIVNSYEPWLTQTIEVLWHRVGDGKVLKTTFNIKVKPKENEMGTEVSGGGTHL